MLNSSMKIHDLFERNQQKTITMYHGTSDTYLKSIMKHGLLATPPNRTYDGDYGNEGYDTYGGVYLAYNRTFAERNAQYAADMHGGTPIIITVQFVIGSGNIDEDLITFIINKNIYIEHNTSTFTRDNKTVDNIVNSIINRFGMIGKIGAPVRSALDNAVHIVFDNVTDIDLDVQDIMGVMKHYPKYKKNIEVIMRNIFPYGIENVQVLRNIGFRGKTKIIKITRNSTVLYSA